MAEELYHHGIKGQHWGKRNGPPYPLDYKSHSSEEKNKNPKRVLGGTGDNAKHKHVKRKFDISKYKNMSMSDLKNHAAAILLGKNTVDTYLETNTTFSRIQSNGTFEQFAFYATYKQHDIDQYTGLFGKNLMSRANAAAKAAEKEALKTGDPEEAKRLREIADNMNIYKLEITNTQRLAIPSEQNAGKIVGKLLDDKDFKDNLEYSIVDSKAKMKRPTQQILFNQALTAMNKDPRKPADDVIIYKALNLSLTNHDTREVAMQNVFYSEMKKQGYSALVDINDQSYSSYHAKRPMIVFDVSTVQLQSVSKVDPETINKLYKKHNIERIAKDTVANTAGLLSQVGNASLKSASDYVDELTNDYLNKR